MPPPPHVTQAVFFIVLLIAATIIDIRKRIIPDSICALIALAGLISFSPTKLFGMLAALPLLIPAICKEGSIGGGDIKLTAACGLVLGFTGGIAGLITGLAVMLLYHAGSQAIGWLRRDKARNKNKAALPMAPFLSFGFVAAYIIMNTGV
jgi:leader peptidase (prepilin peptidase)/N-methyltransferase